MRACATSEVPRLAQEDGVSRVVVCGRSHGETDKVPHADRLYL
jgi:hypothetical protein